MQKKLIALAVAGLAAAPAFAQSNVTIYGRADYGMVTRSGTADGLDNRNIDVNGKTEFASGVQSGSRIGFKGAEDLGNGLKAIFEIEYGLKMDEGTTTSTTWGNRHSYVGLTGNFGTVVGGRLDGVRYNIWGKYDPFANGTVGNMTQITKQVDRADNAIAYISPSWNGLTATVAYSTNIGGTEGANNLNFDPFPLTACPSGTPAENRNRHCFGGNDGDNKLYTFMLGYDNGPLSLNADYEVIKTTGYNGNKLWVATFGASYDFGVVKVSALYDILKSDDRNSAGVLTGGTNGLDNKTWMLAAKAPIGQAFDVRLAYASTSFDNLDNFDAEKWGIGADYKLSKRTNLYADYGQIMNDDSGLMQLSYAGNAYGLSNGLCAGGNVSNCAGSSSVYGTRGFDIGIAHKF
jgi:predicted porin